MRDVRWALVVPFWLLGTITGLMAAYAVTKGFESTLYLVIGVAAGAVIGKLASARPFLHGFLAGAGGLVLDGLVQFSLWSVYVERAPDVIARGDALFPGIDLLTLCWIVLVPFACLGGAMVGLIAWVADMALPASRQGVGKSVAETDITELVQRRFVETRTFHLESGRVRCTVKDADGEIEFFVNYEDLTTQRRSRVEQSPYVYYVAISASVFTVLGLIAFASGATIFGRWLPVWGLAAAIFWGFHIVRRRRYLLIEMRDKKALYFLKSKPTPASLEQFIEAMFAAKRLHLKAQYGEIDFDNDPKSELSKFEWLLKQGAISESEFENIRVKLL